MLIALKEKCKVNTKCLPSANAPEGMALGNEPNRGKRQNKNGVRLDSVFVLPCSVKCGKLEPDDLGLPRANLTTFPPRAAKSP